MVVSMFNKNNVYFVLQKIIIFILIIIFFLVNNNLDFLMGYDAKYYLEISRYGYHNDSLYAFFPLYPILIKIFYYIFRSYLLSGLFISLFCSIVSYYIINKLVSDKNKLMIYIYCPIVIFLSVIYTESLFLMVTLLGYYFYKNKKLLYSSIFIGLGILTRNTGALLFVAVLVDYIYSCIKKGKFNLNKFLILFLVPVGIGCLYPLYLYFNTGNLLYFVDVQYSYWGRENLFFIFGFINDIKVFIRDNFSFFNFYLIVQNWFWVIYLLYLCKKMIKKDIMSFVYTVFSIIVFISSYRCLYKWTTIASVSLFRYVWGVYSIYLYSDILLDKNKVLTFFVRVTCLCNIILYFMGFFVA